MPQPNQTHKITDVSPTTFKEDTPEMSPYPKTKTSALKKKQLAIEPSNSQTRVVLRSATMIDGAKNSRFLNLNPKPAQLRRQTLVPQKQPPAK